MKRRRVSPKRLPLVLDVRDIMYVLRIGETTAKGLFARDDFPRLDVMKRNLVLKDSFFKWLEQEDSKEGN